MRSPIQHFQYQVIPPHPLLVPYIRCYWVLRVPAGQPTRRELILPDGYAELILNYGESYRWQDQARQVEQIIKTVHLVGERDTSILVDLPRGLNQIGVKFKPAGLFALLHQPLEQLANQIVSPSQLGNSSIQVLGEQVFDAPTDEARIEQLNTFFLKRLLLNPLDPLIEKSLKIILVHKGNLRIDDLKAHLDVHYKTLERKFKTYVGLTPKVFARIVRFKYTYKQFHAISAQDPVFFLDAGYYDQNHFIKDFKYFLHTTPSAYVRNQHSVSDEIVRRGLAKRSILSSL
uniref:Transcriptional regulator, AraC family n=1 Tax=Cyanothece sp. (strain PCC 7425 / ATCC 29141) TaxID=395961 RepID=B8HZF1_CYAP4